MRLKYQSLIAFGISTIIFSGCTSSGGGFLNLGVADALRKSKASIFKKKIAYSTTPIGNTGLSLPTFGTQPATVTGPVEIDSYTVQQSVPSTSQMTPAAPTAGCGCGEDTVVSTEQFYMPRQQYVVEQGVSNEVTQQLPTEIVAPPVETESSSPTEAYDLPKVNPLPSDNNNSEVKANESNHFEELDTEGTLEPLGQNEPADNFEMDSQEEVEEIADGQRDKDQSIFEEAELTKRSQIRFDSTAGSTRTDSLAQSRKPKMLTLHARPAQSHNVFNQAANKAKPLETVQASHKPYYRQQNALRQQPTKLSDRGYRQAKNTTSEIEFKPLPPVSETPEVEVLAPKTKLVPLQELNINQGTKNDEIQNSNTRTADATRNDTVKVAPRVPLLRATTVSSASILSLKNLANVIDDKQSQEIFYEANRHTARETTSSLDDVLISGEAAVQR